MKKIIVPFFILFSTSFSFSQNANLLKIKANHTPRHYQLLKEYVDFLALPNTMNDPEQLKANAQFISEMMEKRGI
jgi:hypothetical protein